MMTRWFSLFLAVLPLTACTSISMQLPTSRFESPETLGRGEKRMQAAAGWSAHNNVIFTDDASARPPNFTRARIETNNPLSGSFGFGTFERFDLGLRTSVGPSPWKLTGKYQLLGDSYRNAQQGMFSLALTLGVGFGSSNREGEQRGTFGPGGHKWKTSLNAFMTDAALIAGYRVDDKVLMYAGGFHSNYNINGKINQERSDDGLSPEAEYEIRSGGYQTGANLGVRLEFGAAPGFLTIEGVYSNTRLAAGLNNESFSAGAELGFVF